MEARGISELAERMAELGFNREKVETGLTELLKIRKAGNTGLDLYATGLIGAARMTVRMDFEQFGSGWLRFRGYEGIVTEKDKEHIIHKAYFEPKVPLGEAAKVMMAQFDHRMRMNQQDQLTGEIIPINQQFMNLNNLDDLKKQVVELGFNPKVADELEKHMKHLPPYFTLKDQLPGDRGVVDMTIHFAKSMQSENFSLRKFEVTAGIAPPKPDNMNYIVVSENPENKDKPLVRTFDSPNEAIEFFKKQTGRSELALGEGKESKQLLASRETGDTPNYVNPDFKQAYDYSMVKQTVYLSQNDSPFTASQAANLAQGRTVYRDDLMTQQGVPYKAWVKLDFEQNKDQYNNHQLKTYNDPKYGFDLEKTIGLYNIKDMQDPAKRDALINGMKNGDRVPITAITKDNKEVKVLTEASPRYHKLDFFNEKGFGQKREQFQKIVSMEVTESKNQAKKNGQEQEQGKSRSVSR